MTLAGAISWLQTTMKAQPGIRQAPEYAPDILNDFPAVVAYEGPGTITPGASGEYTMLFSIVVDLHVARRDMARDISTVRGYVQSIPVAILADPTMGGSVSTYSNIQFSGLIQLLPDTTGQVGTIGYRWTIQGVKIRP